MPELINSLVSTIIPVYNRPQMLREAVASVLAQTHRPIEVIVVDDGSTDNTPQVAEELAREHLNEVFFVRQKNSGVGPAREAGRQLACGEFIQYLDSDDLLRPKKFETQVAALRSVPDAGAAYGFICVHHENGLVDDAPARASGVARDQLFPWILVDRWWNTDVPLLRRSLVDTIGPWSDLRWSQDWEYDGRIAALGTRLVHCADWMCDERRHSGPRQTGHQNPVTAPRLLNQLRFLTLMLSHAERGGVAPDSPYRMHFTRWVFATARQLASIGLAREASICLDLADRSAGNCAEARRGLGTFRTLTRILPSRLVAYLAMFKDSVNRKRSPLTLPLSMWYDDHLPVKRPVS